MEKIDQIFTQLDNWRHLPTYQLERRADIFFSLYIKEILEEHTQSSIHDIVIPEFPLHKGTLDENGNNQSFRVDYLALSSDLDKAWLVELKTDKASSRTAQDEYLRKAKDKGFKPLLEGLEEIFRATNAKRKYFSLFKLLKSIGLIDNLDSIEPFMERESLQGISRDLEIPLSSHTPDISLVLIHPDPTPDEIFDHQISFPQVREIVQRQKDPVSSRFAESLLNWERIPGSINA